MVVKVKCSKCNKVIEFWVDNFKDAIKTKTGKNLCQECLADEILKEYL